MPNFTHRWGVPVEYLRNAGVSALQSALPAELFDEVWPSRPRASTVTVPSVVFWLMAIAAMSGESMASAPLALWATLPAPLAGARFRGITEEAFSVARRKLHLEFFRRLFDHLVTRHQAAFGAAFLWRGLRVLGIDGTRLNLPAGSTALKAQFPPPSNQTGSAARPQALLVALVDLWSGVCTRFLVVPVKRAEQFCARWLFRYLKPGDLLLADKNFVSSQSFASIIKRGAHFLMRLHDARYSGAKHKKTKLKRSDEWLLHIQTSTTAKLLNRSLPDSVTVRVIRYQIPGFRPSFLVTSLLDDSSYTCEDLVSLYHERWRQETFYRELKHDLRMTNLRSRSVQGVLKELFVQLTINNAVRWTMAQTAATAGLRPVDLSFRACKRKILAASIRIATIHPARRESAIQSLVQELASLRILVRPGRSYPRRKNEGKPRDKGNGVYARSAIAPGAKGRSIPEPLAFVARKPAHDAGVRKPLV